MLIFDSLYQAESAAQPHKETQDIRRPDQAHIMFVMKTQSLMDVVPIVKHVTILPDLVDYHFGCFFLASLGEQHTCVKDSLIYNALMDPSYWNPIFNIESLSLQNFYLLCDALTIYFDPMTLQNLSFPGCVIHPTVWKDLMRFAKLTDISELDWTQEQGLVHEFLASQQSLVSWTFSEPRPVYEYGETWEDDDGFWVLEEQMPRSHQVLKMGEFVDQILAKLLRLKHLRILPGMFCMSENAMVGLFVSINSLEHIEIGFDVCDLVC